MVCWVKLQLARHHWSHCKRLQRARQTNAHANSIISYSHQGMMAAGLCCQLSVCHIIDPSVRPALHPSSSQQPAASSQQPATHTPWPSLRAALFLWPGTIDRPKILFDSVKRWLLLAPMLHRLRASAAKRSGCLYTHTEVQKRPIHFTLAPQVTPKCRAGPPSCPLPPPSENVSASSLKMEIG